MPNNIENKEQEDSMKKLGQQLRSFLSGFIGEAKTNNLYAIITTIGTIIALFKGCAVPYINDKVKELTTPVIVPVVEAKIASSIAPIHDDMLVLKVRLDSRDNMYTNIWVRVREMDDKLKKHIDK